MLKYVDESVVFEEIPDMVTLTISISNCPYKCKGCHSDYLQKDIGEELTFDKIDWLIEKNKGVNCFLFMGDAGKFDEVCDFSEYIRKKYPELKQGVYTGNVEIPKGYGEHFDFIKTGPYIEEFGPLNKKTTNQRLYEVKDGKLNDVTYRFWKEIL